MSMAFDELANEIKKSWSEEATRLYEETTREYREEVSRRQEIGRACAEARRKKALSQPSLSALSGVRQSDISRIERGLANPTTSTLLRLTHALDCDLVIVPRSNPDLP